MVSFNSYNILNIDQWSPSQTRRSMFRDAEWLAKDTQQESSRIRGWTQVFDALIIGPQLFPVWIRTWFESWLCHSLVLWAWASYFLSESLSFLTCKRRIYLMVCKLPFLLEACYSVQCSLSPTHSFRPGLPAEKSQLSSDDPKSAEAWWSSRHLSFYTSLCTGTATLATSLHG